MVIVVNKEKVVMSVKRKDLKHKNVQTVGYLTQGRWFFQSKVSIKVARNIVDDKN